MLKIDDIKELINFSERNHVIVDLHIGFREKWLSISNEKKAIYLDLEDIDSLSYAEDLNYWSNKAVEELRK